MQMIDTNADNKYPYTSYNKYKTNNNNHINKNYD